MAADSSCNSVATERTETTAVLYLEHYDVCDRPTRGHRPRHLRDVATEHICIGSCVLHWSKVSDLKMGILARLDYEIQDRIRLPLSLETLLARDSALPVVRKRSSSACVEAIARCVAAFQHATDATEHRQCDEIANKMRSYANAIANNAAPCLRECVIGLIHRYIQNRTYDLAVKSVLDGALVERHRFWSRVTHERQHNACLNVIEICNSTLRDEGQFLRDKISTTHS
jgi:hypothetical protein